MAPSNSSGFEVHTELLLELLEITGDTLAKAMSGTADLANIKRLAPAALCRRSSVLAE